MSYFSEVLFERRRVTYPNPFFDVLNHYLPTTLKELFEWFEYAYFSNPVIASALQKFASYPVTEPIVESEDSSVVQKYLEILEELNWKNLLINAGLDLLVYGNAFVVSLAPIVKQAKCHTCGNVSNLKFVKNFKLKEKANFGSGICPKCKAATTFTLYDVINKDEPVKAVRWNPKLITIKRHPLTGECEYYSDVPPELSEGILANDVFIISRTPEPIIQAVKDRKSIEFINNSIYHLKQGSLSGRYQEWGVSPLLPVLKHLFLIQVYRKANEAIAFEHILPLRILFPQPVTANSDPAVALNLANFSKFVEQVI